MIPSATLHCIAGSIVLSVPSVVFAVLCPPMPAAITQLGHDTTQEVTATVSSMKNDSPNVLTRKVTSQQTAVFTRFPNADRMLLAQMMAATYCSMITDDPAKDAKWAAYSKGYIIGLPIGPSATPKPASGAKAPTRPHLANQRPQFLTYSDAVTRLQNGDVLTARENFQRLARKGDGRASYQLGKMFLEGIGEPRDPEQAHKFFLDGANLGIPEAQHNVAVTYQKGEGVPPNKDAAILWFKQAARQGYAPSIETLNHAGISWTSP